MGCSNGNDSDNGASPKNPFVEKTFYGSKTINGEKYDVCKLHFTSETDVTMTLYGQGEKGSDKVEKLKYTVSDGKASVTYNEKKITTSAIKDDTFTASLDGTDENTCSFSTTEGKKYQGSTPTPDPEPKNPFAGKTFYGSITDEGEKYDIYELIFTSKNVTWVIYWGDEEDGSDLTMESVPYTVANGKATMTWDDEGTFTTSVIKNDAFTIIYDADEEEKNIVSFSITQGTKMEAPDTPTAEIKTAAQFQGSIGKFDLEWKNGVAVVEMELDDSYVDNWNNDSDSTISFSLLTVENDWDAPCYKGSEFNFGEKTNLKIATGWGNNIITSTDALAGKKIKLTFTGTEETIKCKAEIVE